MKRLPISPQTILDLNSRAFLWTQFPHLTDSKVRQGGLGGIANQKFFRRVVPRALLAIPKITQLKHSINTNTNQHPQMNKTTFKLYTIPYQNFTSSLTILSLLILLNLYISSIFICQLPVFITRIFLEKSEQFQNYKWSLWNSKSMTKQIGVQS